MCMFVFVNSEHWLLAGSTPAAHTTTGPPMHTDTYWRAVVQGAAPSEQLQLEHPPTCYYSAPCEGLPKQQRPLRLASGRAKQEVACGEAAAPAALTAA